MCDTEINEEKVHQVLKEGEVIFEADNSLACGFASFYINWRVGDTGVTLDSWFELEELEAIVWWMRNKSGPAAQ